MKPHLKYIQSKQWLLNVVKHRCLDKNTHTQE